MTPLATLGPMPQAAFNEWMAERYERLWPELFDPAVIAPTVNFLAELAGDGSALEFGIGTGRIALPLTRRGVAVHGIPAAHLVPGGCFVVENYVPELRRLPPDESIHVFTASSDHLGFEDYDVVTQIAVSHHYWTIDGRLHHFSSPHRYVWPAELDLMARFTGMTLRERWGDWSRSPFTNESRSHLSVWEKPGSTG